MRRRLPWMIGLLGLMASVAIAGIDPPKTWRERLLDLATAVDQELEALVAPPHPHEHGITLRGDDDWIPQDEVVALEGPAIVMLHGLDDTGTLWEDLVEAIGDAPYTLARFDYPNDQRVHDSAMLLVEELESLRLKGVDEVVLIGHSMGGLVAREALTCDEGYRSDRRDDLPEVTRLIMVGTPNHGSSWARFRTVTEVADQVRKWRQSDSWDPRGLFQQLDDGTGEAGHDLLPGSPFLAELNARPLPDLPITLIVGRVAEVDEAIRSEVTGAWVVRQFFTDDEASALADYLVQSNQDLGDGVVSIDSALLEGVRDVEVVEASHRGMITTVAIEQVARSSIMGASHDVPPAIPIILGRLGIVHADEGHEPSDLEPDARNAPGGDGVE